SRNEVHTPSTSGSRITGSPRTISAYCATTAIRRGVLTGTARTRLGFRRLRLLLSFELCEFCFSFSQLFFEAGDLVRLELVRNGPHPAYGGSCSGDPVQGFNPQRVH